MTAPRTGRGAPARRRDYIGAGPAFVLMDGFPDNLHIYDDLIPHLVAAGRRVVTFDFLGFGASDKIPGASYSFKQQLGDLEAVVAALRLEALVPVVHDSSGPAGINFALAHPRRVQSLYILNSAYDAAFAAFVQLASEFFAELARNSARLPELRSLEIPDKVIWGEFDPYITVDVARDRAAHFKNVSLRVVPAGHWLQSDLPAQVAREMLS